MAQKLQDKDEKLIKFFAEKSKFKESQHFRLAFVNSFINRNVSNCLILSDIFKEIMFCQVATYTLKTRQCRTKLSDQILILAYI